MRLCTQNIITMECVSHTYTYKYNLFSHSCPSSLLGPLKLHRCPALVFRGTSGNLCRNPHGHQCECVLEHTRHLCATWEPARPRRRSEAGDELPSWEASSGFVCRDTDVSDGPWGRGSVYKMFKHPQEGSSQQAVCRCDAAW